MERDAVRALDDCQHYVPSGGVIEVVRLRASGAVRVGDRRGVEVSGARDLCARQHGKDEQGSDLASLVQAPNLRSVCG